MKHKSLEEVIEIGLKGYFASGLSATDIAPDLASAIRKWIKDNAPEENTCNFPICNTQRIDNAEGWNTYRKELFRRLGI